MSMRPWCAVLAHRRFLPQGDEVESKGPQGHPTDLARKLKGERSMLGKRINRKVCTVMHRKSCAYGETRIGSTQGSSCICQGYRGPISNQQGGNGCQRP